jgi:chromosome segregation ATPase
MATRIKFVNRMKPDDTHAMIKQRQPRRPAQDPPLEARGSRQEYEARRGEEGGSRQEYEDGARQTYEECRKAFNELGALHSSAQTEAADALRRLDKTEQELRRARVQSTGYAAQIASQELEMRRVKEGKRAVDDLNTRLSAKLSGKGGDDALERDRLRAAHRGAAEERDQLRAAHRAAAAERDTANRRAQDCNDMLDHVDKAIGLCARACEHHAPETAKDMQETRETLRAFRQSTSP